MFFNLSKILTFLLDPYFWILSGIILLALTSSKRIRLLLFSGLFALFILSSNTASSLLLSSLENTITTQAIPENIDYIIVLGGMIDLEKSTRSRLEFSSSTDRILEAVKIYHNHPGSKLLFTGGSGSLKQNDGSEAVLIQPFILRQGVKREDLIIEGKSRNTRENALFSKKLIPDFTTKTNLLITSAFHMKRSVGCFNAAGLPVIPVKVDFRSLNSPRDFRDYFPSSEGLGRLALFIHESAGIAAYKWKGYM